MTCLRGSVMYMAAAMISMRLDVSAPMSAENCIGSTWTSNPDSLPTAVMMSTITPWIRLLCVSRNVNGIPVGVEPTFRVCWAEAGAPSPSQTPTTARHRRRSMEFFPPIERERGSRR